MKQLACLCLVAAALATPATADAPKIVAAQAEQASDGTWRIDVSIAHPDTGWDHFANAWEVLGPDGTSLGLRDLAHPHETEQPFTRSLSGVAIPAGIATVAIRAKCNMDGWAPARFTLDLAR